MHMKRTLALCIALVLAFTGFSSNVAAQTRGYTEIQPFWQNVSSVVAVLSFDGTTAHADARVVGFDRTTNIDATITLVRRNANGTYTNVQTWTANTNNTTLNFTNSVNVARGFVYVLTVTATVTRDGFPETVSTTAERGLW